MKAKIASFIIMSVFAISCQSDPERNQTIVGEWNWKQSTGVDENFAEFHQDPTTDGYFLTLVIGSGELQLYKDGVLDARYSYTFNTSSDALQQILVLTYLQGSSILGETYYWEVSTTSSTNLFLRNAGFFTIGCCEYKVEHQFELSR